MWYLDSELELQNGLEYKDSYTNMCRTSFLMSQVLVIIDVETSGIDLSILGVKVRLPLLMQGT